MPTNFLKKIKDSLVKENPFVSIVDEGIISDVDTYTDTGSYMLNAVLSGDLFGGLPNKKITVFAGETTVGKTYLCFSIMKNFLDSDPDAQVIYMESEGALTREMFIDRKIDSSRVLVVPIQTVQDFRKTSLQVLEEYIAQGKKGKLLMILDSLGNLSTSKEMEDSLAGKETQDMTRSRLIKSAFRTITLKLSVADVSMIVTNHVYDEQGLYPRKIMSGGSGIHYNAAVTIFLSKKKDKDSSGDIVGNILTAKVMKSRFIRENKTAEIYLDYVKGLNKYYGLLDLGIEAGLFTKVGHKYQIGETKAFEKAIYKNPEKYFTDEVLQELNEYVKKSFRYGTGESLQTEDDDIFEESED
jgi:RecA/RadA recombinase